MIFQNFMLNEFYFFISDESDVTNGHLETPLEWIAGMPQMRLKDMPSFVRSTNPDDIAFNRWLEEAQDNLKTDGIIFNCFEAFESEVLSQLSSLFPNKIYNVGPLVSLHSQMTLSPKTATETVHNNTRPSLWKENTECLTWLDKQKPNSVVYVNFGSIAVMTENDLKEFAWGLANSGYPFLWIARSDVVMGRSANFPQEFLEKTKDRGMIVSWCPQDKVLKHPSIGVFLTHSGWNSTLESICGGVPMICWPFFAEQQVNCRYACTSWGVGLEIGMKVTREEVEAHVREMMEGENGIKMRHNALDWKKKSEEAVVTGGSALADFDWLVKDLKKRAAYI